VPDVVVELGASLRPELKEPLGPVFTDTEALLAATSRPLVAVGDVVTYHLLEAGRVPEVALVDERTERSAVDPAVSAAIEGFDRAVEVSNPPATLTASLVSALREAVEDAGSGTTLIDVDGEEDLATLPALLVVPRGGSVVYGQPGEGMVHAAVGDETTARARDLLSRLDGDTDRLFSLLEG
jgi:uncharacterized protein (UPF0218 family)